MRAFAELIIGGLRSRGHRVEASTAPVLLGRLAVFCPALAKWLHYLDAFALFPLLLQIRLWRLGPSSLVVLVDQALGPWMFWVGRHAHLIHCHDLLALEGALGWLPEHRPGFTGRLYQCWIRAGFRRGRCFLAVSQATQASLQRHLHHRPLLTEVLLNPLLPQYRPITIEQARRQIELCNPTLAGKAFLLHIGSNWYKNRQAVLEIWAQLHCRQCPVQLVLVGSKDPELQSWIAARGDLQPRVHWIPWASQELLVALYNAAQLLLFPSLYEGFGWPILEALACGCPVVTLERAPMMEVGGPAAFYLPVPPRRSDTLGWQHWVTRSADQLERWLSSPEPMRAERRQQGLAWAAHFDQQRWLDQLEAHYQRALAMQMSSRCAA